ncbi:MAG: ABC transporter ATP-binding protein [Gammaproteobacteria bacterium]|nr:ABC transporter ATP-binding protein [Gammaproteobacteria bacterium]
MSRRSRALFDREVRWALGFVRPYAKWLVLILALSLASTALSLYIPYLSKDLVDTALLGQDGAALTRIVALFAGITVVSFGLNVVSGMRYTRTSADILFDMRLALYRHLQRLSPRFYARTPIGDIMSRINNDIGEIQRVVSESLLSWLGNIAYLLGTVGILLWLDARLFLVSLAILPPCLWALVRYRRRLESVTAELRERSAGIGSFLIETILGLKLTVASNAQRREQRRFRRKNDAFIHTLMSMRLLTYLAGGLPGLILAGGVAVIFLYGGQRVIAEAITMGTFVAFMAYQMRLLGPIQGLMGLYASLATARVSLGRVHVILDTPVEVREPEAPVHVDGLPGEKQGEARKPGAPVPGERLGGEMRLEGVSFSFGRGEPVLDGVDLVVAEGEVVAVVGASGSGKSTIVDLLSRQLDPDAGRILLGGRDLRALRLADVRAAVVPVEQEPFLFNTTIAENIRYGRPDASDAEVAAAARAVGLDAFLATLPVGLETQVGEQGRELSAGQRQRVAVARAFLADPRVLVLDEPTSSLDPASERALMEGYQAVMRDRTTILVSHRLALARRADRVVVLERGRIVEEGTATELLGRRGTFARLFGGEEG